ncbi:MULTISPECIES: hypothetical protein [unclassified Kitasatospora]|uniref:hypothetical protein n=1 Tax=unclassified Kitasatospora TaxID=2633591 RepID=UPI00070C03E6|nr:MULTISPECIES: hypothetical protein [unclassified Kitasatospora]KQV17486.1 hypothetical protein ASC99_25250 [Kitasatospora sp. Root107]KRB69266.1 hypothetical protein ASE03_27925 [Kitasatospora sp. Root187]
MILLGVLLLAAAGAFTGLLIADNLSGGPDYTVTVLGNQIATMNSLAIFLSGIALALIFGLGVLLAAGGGARIRRRSGQRREARAEAGQATAARDAALQERVVTEGPPPTAGDAAPTPTLQQHRSRHLFGH